MASLKSISERIAEKHAAHMAKADEYAARLDGIDKREPEVFAHVDNVMDGLKGNLDGIESDMKALSNLPLGNGSDTSESASLRSTEIAAKQGGNK